MKKFLLGVVALLLILAIGIYIFLFTSTTRFDEPKKYLYIPTASNHYSHIIQTLKDSQWVQFPALFDLWAKQRDLPAEVKPGKYAIEKGNSVHQIVQKLINGQQEPVNLVITKLRTKAQLSRLIGRRLESDSATMMKFLNDADEIERYDVDTNTVMSLVLPNTYTYYWNSNPVQIFDKLKAEYDRFWNTERKSKAEKLGLTPTTAYILASIVEEETNANDEKDTIASVYLNRIKKGHKLQADPTVKFALQDFSLTRILHGHLTAESPYNTYRYAGLPPGPICTPSLKTLEKVLEAPETDYFYFVAKHDFSGRHTFAVTYSDHLKNARLFHKALNERQKAK
ncbi:endolytic transglycosylase MltG [Gynurincola endophyticus]|jgi:UPF0755 protein|uniref:endolytic transglycosylase MltG n=1 Tax=Gynurincola endophyticus TaxID=2479004 RepID=UPI000F8EA03E|nr:endolytic transglycosylase MltG [Gynurincola endophyticus]